MCHGTLQCTSVSRNLCIAEFDACCVQLPIVDEAPEGAEVLASWDENDAGNSYPPEEGASAPTARPGSSGPGAGACARSTDVTSRTTGRRRAGSSGVELLVALYRGEPGSCRCHR